MLPESVARSPPVLQLYLALTACTRLLCRVCPNRPDGFRAPRILACRLPSPPTEVVVPVHAMVRIKCYTRECHTRPPQPHACAMQVYTTPPNERWRCAAENTCWCRFPPPPAGHCATAE